MIAILAAAALTASLNAPDQVKATGCVVKDEQGQVTLVDATVEVQPFYGPGAASFKGTPKPQASKTTFILTRGTDLAGHVGQTVAVVGKVEPGSATSGGVPTGGVQVVYVPRLAVQSIATVAATCK